VRDVTLKSMENVEAEVKTNLGFAPFGGRLANTEYITMVMMIM
jgi:hypothetical protein